MIDDLDDLIGKRPNTINPSPHPADDFDDLIGEPPSEPPPTVHPPPGYKAKPPAGPRKPKRPEAEKVYHPSVELKKLERQARERTRKGLPIPKRNKPKSKPTRYRPLVQTDFGEVPEANSVDTRTPEPILSLQAGQKLFDRMEDKFPAGKGITPEPSIRTLDARERALVTYLFNGMPSDEAAEKAGYPVNKTDTSMWLVTRPHIKVALEWMQQEYLRSIGATLTNVVTQMTHIGFLDPRRVIDDEGKTIPLHKLDHATAAAISEVEVTEREFNGASTVTKTRYKFNSKLKALQQLGEHLGLFNQVQKVEITGEGGGPIQMEMTHTEIARRIAFVLRGQAEVVDVDTLPPEG